VEGGAVPDLTYTQSVWLVSSFATHAVCGLYTIIVIVIGLVLSLSTAFTHQLGQESYYLEVGYHLI